MAPRSIEDPEVTGLLSRTYLQSQKFYPSPLAWEDQVLYFLLPDRFSNNDEDGVVGLDGQPSTGGTHKFNRDTDFGDAVNNEDDATVWREAGKKFVGGTLQGVTSKLGYLKNLGVSALWVGPIFKQVPWNPELYHGYAVQDFFQIEPRFGTPEDLRVLVKTAHEHGIYVILDIILNHCGDTFTYIGGSKYWTGATYEVQGFNDQLGKPTLPFQPINLSQAPENSLDCAVWPIELQGPGSLTRKGEIRNWDYYPEYLEGDFFSLKDINIGPNEPDNFVPTDALKALCDVYKYWIAYADLDGFRVDTVKHMGDGPARYLASVIHEFATSIGKNMFFLVGEITGNRAWEVVETTGLDAALGIGNVQQSLWEMTKGLRNPSDYFDLFRNALYLKKDSQAWFRNKIVTMVDDHDQVWRGGGKARYCALDEGDRLIFAALALNLCTLGVPCIYYGSEQQFDGQGGAGDAADRYIREAMFGGKFGAFRSHDKHCFDDQNPVYQEISKVAAIRHEYMSLRRGRQYLREISGDGTYFWYPYKIGGDRMTAVVAWSRIFADEEILCAVNTNPDGESSAWVTIDNGLHAEGDELECIYPKGSSVVPQKVSVVSKNGKAAFLKVSAGGFVMYR